MLFVLAAGVLAAVVWEYEQGLPDYSQLKNYEPPVTTRVHAADGSLLAEISREPGASIFRQPKFPASSSTPLFPPKTGTFTATGASIPEGIVRAGIIFMQGSRRIQGASTITQQVAKNFLLNSDRTFERKIREILLSLQIEIRLLKGRNPRTLPQ